jgi:hypothetical protein
MSGQEVRDLSGKVVGADSGQSDGHDDGALVAP